jgi:hypothetical protein
MDHQRSGPHPGDQKPRHTFLAAGQPSLGHADRRKPEHRAQVDGKPSPTRVIETGGVDQEHIRPEGEGSHRSLEESAFTEGEIARRICGREPSLQHI